MTEPFGQNTYTNPPAPPNSGKKLKGPLGAIGAFLAATWKFILPAFKFLKGAKFLMTGLTMVASMWFYSLAFGWWFAVGFVICIFIHELGHVAMSIEQGIPVSAPFFIPGFGALIVQKKWAKSAMGEALIGIGGPMAGALAALGCWALYFVTGQGIFLGLSFFGFFINLFNMIPIFPLDGGRIVGAISPYLWLIGLVTLVGLSVTGFIRNPFIWLIIIMSIPHLWDGLKRGTADPRGGVVTTKPQRILMGIAYIGLSGLLLIGMASTREGSMDIRSRRPTRQAQVE
jgi:Zn-dependent protease